MLRNCQNNSHYFGYNYFFEGDLCCYSSHDGYANLKSCFCASDYCNNYILQPAVISQSNDTTTSTTNRPRNASFGYTFPTSIPGNNSGLVNCFNCWHSGVANNVSTNFSCEEPSISHEGSSCGGEACATYASTSAGNGSFL